MGHDRQGHIEERMPVHRPARRLRELRETLAAALAVIAVLVGSAHAVEASCGVLGGAPPADPYAQAPVVFVGTVVSTTHGGRLAVVDVESTWRGPDLPPRVEVRGSSVILTPMPAGMGAATSVDRHFQAGGRYLFAPAGRQPPFQDGSCSLTRVYAPDLDALRPTGARPPLAPDAAAVVPNAFGAAARGAALPPSGETVPVRWPVSLVAVVALLGAVAAVGALAAAGVLARGIGRSGLHSRRAAGQSQR